ncbi:MAG: DUF2851 family protein [Parachlamydiaceae bacterium]|nr:DUF2851 family protein [Parachlamydiaceae bacterium]
MVSRYSKLLMPFSQLAAENKQNFSFLTERHVQAMWFEQKYFKGLKTAAGEPIKVLSSGIWNINAGPDFLKAHLKIGNVEFFGDIEIHLTDSCWQQHQHHIDPKYNHVILHISFWNSRKPVGIFTSNGSTILQTHLENYLTIPLPRLNQLIDLDLYPYKKFIGSGRCAIELFRELSADAIQKLFERAADWRLTQKRNFLKHRVEDPKCYVGAGIAMALGYKSNTDQFLELFLALQEQQFDTEEETLAWLLGKTGFFSASYETKWGKSSKFRLLRELYSCLPSEKPIALHLNQIRPLNHPVRRLVSLSKLYYDVTIPPLLTKIDAEWSLQWKSCFAQKKWKSLLEIYKSWLPGYKDDYWNNHYLFEDHTTLLPLSLIGEDLKQTIVINLFLPFAEEKILQRGHPDEMAAFQQMYRTLPSAKSGKSKYLTHRFFGNSKKGSILKNAYTEQGAYQLHYDFCSHFEASCEGCPFVERYKSLFR